MAAAQARTEQEYQTWLQLARRVDCDGKKVICPNYYYAFHVELELQLNCYFHDPTERWVVLFTEIQPPPNFHHRSNRNERISAPVTRHLDQFFFIYHNAKVKYRCHPCKHEWASAQGRALCQTSVPVPNTYNVLFIDLFPQKCRICDDDVQPSWYQCEVTRVMHETSRILIEEFYRHRNFPLLPAPPQPAQQRSSHTRGPHQHHLCAACLQGSCLTTHP